jgi:hypothetical protein
MGKDENEAYLVGGVLYVRKKRKETKQTLHDDDIQERARLYVQGVAKWQAARKAWRKP